MNVNLAHPEQNQHRVEVINSKPEGIKQHLHSKSYHNHTHYHSANKMATIDTHKRLKIDHTPQQITQKNGRLIIIPSKELLKTQSTQRLKSQTERNHYAVLPKGQKKPFSIKQYIVEHENKRLIEAIRSHELDRKEFKRKLATEVSQYVKLRQHMHKFKRNFTLVLSRRTPLKSEKQKSQDFQRFLTTAIEATKKKIQEAQFSTSPAAY